MADKKVLDRRFFPADTLIIEEGSLGNCAYYIESGLVEVFTKATDGQEIRLSLIGVEEIFGEMALISNEKRTASVRTVEDSTVIIITQEDFKYARSSANKVLTKLLNVLVERLVEANNFIVNQHKEIVDLEESTNFSVKTLAYSLPPELRPNFQKEIKPILAELMLVIDKYKKISESNNDED